MPGAFDPNYVAARRVLLDTLAALGLHRASVTLIGAQAIYLHAGEADIAVSPYTTDSDLALDPRSLAAEPLLETVLRAAGLVPGPQPGIWRNAEMIQVDLLVPHALGGSGRRGARLSGHGNMVARKTAGIEGCLVDRALHPIGALDGDDPRSFELFVAGPGALVVAKCLKLHERLEDGRQIEPKDALDVYRLVRLPAEDLAARVRRLQSSDLAADTTRRGLEALAALFGSRNGRGSHMAADAAGITADPNRIRVACEVLTQQLLSCLDSG